MPLFTKLQKRTITPPNGMTSLQALDQLKEYFFNQKMEFTNIDPLRMELKEFKLLIQYFNLIFSDRGMKELKEQSKSEQAYIYGLLQAIEYYLALTLYIRDYRLKPDAVSYLEKLPILKKLDAHLYPHVGMVLNHIYNNQKTFINVPVEAYHHPNHYRHLFQFLLLVHKNLTRYILILNHNDKVDIGEVLRTIPLRLPNELIIAATTIIRKRKYENDSNTEMDVNNTLRSLFQNGNMFKPLKNNLKRKYYEVGSGLELDFPVQDNSSGNLKLALETDSSPNHWIIEFTNNDTFKKLLRPSVLDRFKQMALVDQGFHRISVCGLDKRAISGATSVINFIHMPVIVEFLNAHHTLHSMYQECQSNISNLQSKLMLSNSNISYKTSLIKLIKSWLEIAEMIVDFLEETHLSKFYSEDSEIAEGMINSFMANHESLFNLEIYLKKNSSLIETKSKLLDSKRASIKDQKLKMDELNSKIQKDKSLIDKDVMPALSKYREIIEKNKEAQTLSENKLTEFNNYIAKREEQLSSLTGRMNLHKGELGKIRLSSEMLESEEESLSTQLSKLISEQKEKEKTLCEKQRSVDEFIQRYLPLNQLKLLIMNVKVKVTQLKLTYEQINETAANGIEELSNPAMALLPAYSSHTSTSTSTTVTEENNIRVTGRKRSFETMNNSNLQ